jgi:putative endonuclease
MQHDPNGGTVYLLHFAEPIGNPDSPYGSASHYMGWTSDLGPRLAAHRDGAGAAIMRAVAKAGIDFEVARTWEGGRQLERELKNRHDHPGLCPDCRSRDAAEQAFDRLNPDFGALADSRDPAGHRDVQDRETGLALGTRVAVATSRENDPHPVLEIIGQDYRAADAARTATRWPTSAAAWGAVPESEHGWGWER